jgi:hypothetical protein
VCVVIYNILYAKVAYSEDVSLLEESVNINKGTEAHLDTSKHINLINNEKIHMDVPTPDENKCVNAKNIVCYRTVNNVQFSMTLGNSHVH